MDNKKHVIITGGAKGIGASCVNIFARDSHNVTILDIDIQRVKNWQLPLEIRQTLFIVMFQ